MANALRQRWRRPPLTALRNKATARVNYSSVIRGRLADDTANDKLQKCRVLAIESVAIQFSFVIKFEHHIHEPGDLAWNSIAKLNDYIDHTHSLTGEARQALDFRIIEHACELRSRQPVQVVVWANNEYSG